MHYFALLLSPETDGPVDPEAQSAEMAAYQAFHAAAASAIRGGDALLPRWDMCLIHTFIKRYLLSDWVRKLERNDNEKIIYRDIHYASACYFIDFRPYEHSFCQGQNQP